MKDIQLTEELKSKFEDYNDTNVLIITDEKDDFYICDVSNGFDHFVPIRNGGKIKDLTLLELYDNIKENGTHVVLAAEDMEAALDYFNVLFNSEK